MLGPKPLLGEPSTLQPSGEFKVGESNLRMFLGGYVGSVSINEKTKHFEKNCNCAISQAQRKTFVKDKKNL